MSSINYHSDQKTILDLQNMYQNGQLELSPGFQRSSVWTDRDRKKLINSVLRDYPLPAIFLYCRRSGRAQIVVRLISRHGYTAGSRQAN